MVISNSTFIASVLFTPPSTARFGAIIAIDEACKVATMSISVALHTLHGSQLGLSTSVYSAPVHFSATRILVRLDRGRKVLTKRWKDQQVGFDAQTSSRLARVPQTRCNAGHVESDVGVGWRHFVQQEMQKFGGILLHSADKVVGRCICSTVSALYARVLSLPTQNIIMHFCNVIYIIPACSHLLY